MENGASGRRLAAWAIFCLALSVRLIGLGDQPYSQGELFSLGAANWDGAWLTRALNQARAGPLFYLLVDIWRRIGGEAVWWLRLLPVLFSAGSVVVFFFLAARKITDSTAGVAAIFLALHPMSVWMGRDLIPFAAAGFFVLLSAWYATEWLASHGEGAKAPMVLFATLALYTHHAAWLYLLFLSLAAFTARLLPGFSSRYAYGPILAIFALALPLALSPCTLLHIPDIPASGAGELLPSNYAGLAFLFPQIPLPSSALSLHTLFDAFPALSQYLFQSTLCYEVIVFLLSIALVLLGVWGGVKHPFLGHFFLIPLVGAVGIQFLAPGLLGPPLYLLIFLPAGLACVAAGIGELAGKGLAGRGAAGLVALMFVAVSLLSLQGSWNESRAHRITALASRRQPPVDETPLDLYWIAAWPRVVNLPLYPGESAE